jgi:hypothetical protein
MKQLIYLALILPALSGAFTRPAAKTSMGAIYRAVIPAPLLDSHVERAARNVNAIIDHAVAAAHLASIERLDDISLASVMD